MAKNLYYKGVLQRDNFFQKLVLSFFAFWASYPRLLLEVFIRKNFGERYFRLSSAITVVILFGALPFFLKWASRILGGLIAPGNAGADFDLDVVPEARTAGSSSMTGYVAWFIFLAIFLAFSIKRHIEKRRNPSVFDFAKFSLYSGDINPAFFKVQIAGKKPHIRLVETLLEPAPFFIAGLVLWLLNQNLGILLVVCSIFYALGYVAAYRIGDDFVMDKIDEMICNQELKKAFVDGLDENKTRGFRFVGHRPEDIETRRQILPLMLEKQEETAVVS